MKVFYDERQTVTEDVGFSPSAGKPAAVVASWRALGLPLEVIAPEPVTAAQLALAHDPTYVADVLAGRRANGFGNTSPAVAASLPWTSGSMLAAARHALRTGEAAISPTSGFHHARYASGGGFCTFNGLVVTAQVVLAEGLAARVGIIDCDEHFGDGTEDIVRKLGLETVQHYTFGGEFVEPTTAEAWLARLPAIVAGFARCNVILYQAGADPHVDDPLGGALTTEQLARRDRIVFEAARAIGVPVAWNLAGGYQAPLRKVLDLHDNTLLACAEVYGLREPLKGGA